MSKKQESIRSCSVLGCGAPSEVKGSCKRCYNREYMRAYNRAGRNRWREERTLLTAKVRADERVELAAKALKAKRMSDQKRRKHKRYRAQYLEASLRNSCKQYGMTVERYREMTAEQGGVCAVCQQPSSRKRLTIDHCHKTGKVRGLLCGNCNAGLGMFRDDQHIVGRAQEYLRAR